MHFEQESGAVQVAGITGGSNDVCYEIISLNRVGHEACIGFMPSGVLCEVAEDEPCNIFVAVSAWLETGSHLPGRAKRQGVFLLGSPIFFDETIKCGERLSVGLSQAITPSLLGFLHEHLFLPANPRYRSAVCNGLRRLLVAHIGKVGSSHCYRCPTAIASDLWFRLANLVALRQEMQKELDRQVAAVLAQVQLLVEAATASAQAAPGHAERVSWPGTPPDRAGTPPGVGGASEAPWWRWRESTKAAIHRT